MKIVDFINLYNPNIINPYIILLPNFDPEGGGGGGTSHTTFQMMSLINPNQAEVSGSLIM